MNTMIDFIFALLNFFIVSVLLFYGIKRYALPWLSNQLKIQKNERAEFIAHLHRLEKEMAVVESKRQIEEQRLVDYLEKFKLWKIEQKSIQQAQQEEAQAIAQQMSKREEMQQKNYEAQYLIQETKQEALQEAERELIQYFAVPEHHESYTQAITHYIKEARE